MFNPYIIGIIGYVMGAVALAVVMSGMNGADNEHRIPKRAEAK